MAIDKQKLPRFIGDSLEGPARHYKTCITIWQTKGQNDAVEWLKAFLATLRGIAIDWYMDLEAGKKNTRNNIRTTFEEEFRLLRDDDEIVTKIYNTR